MIHRKMAMNPHPKCPPGRTLLLILGLLLLLDTGCSPKVRTPSSPKRSPQAATAARSGAIRPRADKTQATLYSPLPAEADLETDELLIFVHGYMGRADSMEGFAQAFALGGIPRLGLEPIQDYDPLRYDRPAMTNVSLPPELTPKRYHVHRFNFSFYSRAGDGRNTPLESLAGSFRTFYENLHRGCAVCRRREGRPVKVTLIGHSFGGVLLRHFLLQEADRNHSPWGQERAAGLEGRPWTIARMVTLGTPWFGSVLTRLTRGFLNLAVNGVVRAGVLGFVHPDMGGTFGNVIDNQARTLRIGSPYLWDAHFKWIEQVKALQARGQQPPPWLLVVSADSRDPQRDGDNIARFASANLAPLLPGGTAETYFADTPHIQLVELTQDRRIRDEENRILKAIQFFLDHNTLRGGPRQVLSPWARVRTSGRVSLLPSGLDGVTLRAAGDGVLQTLFFQGPSVPGRAEQVAVNRKRDRLETVLKLDAGDVWLRFYEGHPGGTGAETPRVLPLAPHLSFFENGLEPSRSFTDLAVQERMSADGESLPVLHSVTPLRSHLIAIPDVTPTGPHRLWIRLEQGVVLDEQDVVILTEGVDELPTVPGSPSTGAPLWIHPQQPNLVRVYLNGARIRQHHPRLKRIEIRELALVPETEP